MSELTSLEAAVLDYLLSGDDGWLAVLREQRRVLRVIDREYSGVGFFTNVMVPAEAPRIDGTPTIRFGDVVAEIDGLKHGATFVLFVDDGVITMLEGCTYDEPWPETVDAFSLHYTVEPRDPRAALRGGVP